MADDAPRLLAGGNPQIPKGEGNGPVQAYIAAMPGWKQDVGGRLDVHEDGPFDEERFTSWVRQAAELPLERL